MSLEKLRHEAGLSLHALADKSGVHYMKIHQIERGKIKAENITLRTATKLAKALDCQAEDLMPTDL